MINEYITWYNFKNNSVDTNSDVKIDEPRQCMHCKNTGEQVFLRVFGTFGKHDLYNAIALFACQLCGSTSIHYLVFRNIEEKETELIPVKSIPSINKGLFEFSSNIEEIFPSFCKIYNQSKKAEDEDLDQIAGMGYRKALEFLVTDYLLQYPVEGVSEEWLTSPNTTLGNKIAKISSRRIQKLARAISFIGNDETHYTRRHPEHDIHSIKAFIRVLISEIENEIEFQKAKDLINKSES